MSKLLSLRTQLKAAKTELVIRTRMANAAERAKLRAIGKVAQINERINRETHKIKLARSK